MSRFFWMVLVALFSITSLFGQQKLTYSRHAGQMTELQLKAWQQLLTLRVLVTHPHLPEYQEHCSDNIVRKDPDSTVVFLKSGLSWELGDGPPNQPRHFLFKLLSKKGRERQEVKDWVNYQQFVFACDEKDELAYEMVDQIVLYYSFKNESGPCLHLGYMLKRVEEGRFKLFNREVTTF